MDNKSARQSILKHIDAHRDEVLNFLRKLIQFDSVTGNEKNIQEFIAKYLREMGLEIDVWDLSHDELKNHPAYTPTETDYSGRPNVIGKYKGAGGGRSLLFNGHVDVISPGPVDEWEHGAFSGEVHEGKMYGRGSSDMKSGLATMTMAVKTILELGLKLKGDILLEYAVDEELTGHGTLNCVIRGYKADSGISCETSDLNVQPAAIGRMWYEISVEGKPAGISRRWQAVSAIEKGYMITKAIDDFEQIRIREVKHPLYPDNRGGLACGIGMFEAGSYPSATPDKCTLRGSIATLPGEDSYKVQQKLIDYVAKVASSDPWLKDHPPKVRFYGLFAPPAEIPADHPICMTLISAFREVTGKMPVLSGREGAADTRFLIPYGKVPTVIFGPGTTAQMHAMNEWVSVEDLIVATKVLALTIVDWCGLV